MDVYSADVHLRQEDNELFTHKDTPWLRRHRQARQDLDRDLQARGYVDVAGIVDRSSKATVTLTFLAGDGDDPLVIPAGTIVRDIPTSEAVNGVTRFATDEELEVDPEEEGTVTATCLSFGEPGNVEAGTLIYLEGTEPDNFASVTNEDDAVGGADHQLTRAAVYRTLEMVYGDLMRTEEDSFNFKREVAQKAYEAELDRLQSSGLETGASDDVTGTMVSPRNHGRVRLERS